MNKIRVVGIDIAKSVFQVCVWMVDGSVAWNRKISRQKLLDTLRQFEPDTLIAMEACSTSHFRGRILNSMGYSVRLIPCPACEGLCQKPEERCKRCAGNLRNSMPPWHSLCTVQNYGTAGYQSGA